jgi:ribose transport system substrate-binding protein
MNWGGKAVIRNRSWKLGIAAATVCALLGLASYTAHAQGGKPLTIAFFVKNLSNPNWLAARIGAEKAAKELGVKIEHVAPTKPDNIEEQTRLTEDWLVKRPDGFVFVPVDFKALIPAVQKAIDAKMPVALYSNNMPDVQGAVTYVGSDDTTIEYEISKFLFKKLGGKGKIVHIDGNPAAITAQQRKTGFERALKEYPGIELLASQPGQYRRLPAVQVFENLMQRYPQIDGVVSANDDMAVGVVETLAAAGRADKTLVVGVDVIPDAVALLKEGKMFASADYSLHDQAYLAVTALVKKLRGESVPARIILPVKIATKDNISHWAAKMEDRATPKWAEVVAAQGR